MVLAKIRVGEFDQFWSVFTSEGAEHRAKFGSSGSRVLRNQQDPNEVWVLFDWSGEDFQRFLEDPRAKEIMASAGLQGPPEPVFVDSVGEVGS